MPGDAAFVSEQLSRRLNLRLGDHLEIPAPGGSWNVEVAGIYADYGNPKGQLTVNIAALDPALSRDPANPDGAARRPRPQGPR